MSKILVVDDEKSIRDFLRETLEIYGHEVLTAETAVQGLEFLSKNQFDMIISDIRMPGISGIRFLEQVRARYSQIPMILLSAYTTVEEAVYATKIGAADYLTKPITPAALKEKVDAVLSGAVKPQPGTGDVNYYNLPLKMRWDKPEAQIIKETLMAHGGHVTRAANALKISRMTLYNKLKKYGLEPGRVLRKKLKAEKDS
ncbi:MAG: response regulator [Verrucomicrobiae bacterium]|nr:response regulator [Verrucomicrobiae bacterium]